MYLDPFYDRRSGYYFMVNAAGTLYDGTLSNDGWEDGSWDGVWEGKAHVDKEGWTCEMRIPYSQMRFAKAQEYKWGINFRRVIPRNAEEDFLVYPPKRSSGFVSRFPALVGIENVSPVTAVELMPYVTSQAEMLADATTTDPFNHGTKLEPDAGGDLRMPVGSRLTLNATVNPDFGQVEVDPAVVNLSDVETFYPEKRPFFVENASVFSTGNQGASDYWGFNWPEPNFFYSRRIGRTPQGTVPDADYTDVPPGTTILGAAKLTGKLTPTVNFGTLHALTAREHADLSTGGNQWQSEVEPLTYYGVARGLKEFKGRKQGIGALATLTARSFENTALRDEFNSASMLGVMDGWFFLDKNETWVISGWSAVTQVQGNETRMTELQQDPRHYFQRPDANSVEVDPNATSMTGVGTRLWLNKQKGNTFGNFAAGFMSPKFELNDLGFESRADVINGHAGYGYKWTKPTKTRKYQDVLGAVFASYDFDGNPTWGGVWGGGSTEFPNNYSLTYRAAYNPQTVNPRRTRGGPLMLNMPGYETYLYFDTDSKSKLFYYVEAYSYTQPDAPSQDWNVYPGIEIKPVSNLTLNIGLGYDDTRESAQYLDTIVDATATTTYGSRYIFGDLVQKTWSASIRLNWAFSPTMSLQFYGQPLISTGDYQTVRELARPKSYEFLGAGAGTWTYDPVTRLYDRDGPGPEEAYNPDFNASRYAVTPCSAGSTCRARRCSWCGRNRARTRTSATSTCGRRCPRSSAPTRATSSWPR
jgi:hypothetical protein